MRKAIFFFFFLFILPFPASGQPASKAHDFTVFFSNDVHGKIEPCG